MNKFLAFVVFELEVYPEPKFLSRAEMHRLMRLYGSQEAVAEFLECSQAHVSERLNLKWATKPRRR